MTLANRARKHVVLAISEAVVTLLATVGVVLLLALAGGGVVGGRAFGAALGIEGSTLVLLTGVVAIVPLVGALSVPYFAVAEYRRFFGRYGTNLWAVVVVPLLVVVGSTTLAAGSWTPTGAVVVIPSVVAAHLLALRVLGYRSRTTSGRTEQFVAVVGTIPLAVALLTTVTVWFSDGAIADAGRLLVSTPGWQSVPTDSLALVLAPLAVVTLFEGLRSIPREDRFAPQGRVDDVERRLRRRGRSVSSITDTCRSALSALAGRVRGSDEADSRTAPPVPTPPQSARRSHERLAGRDEDSGTDCPPTPPAVAAPDGPTEGTSATESNRDTQPTATASTDGPAAVARTGDRPEPPTTEPQTETEGENGSATDSEESSGDTTEPPSDDRESTPTNAGASSDDSDSGSGDENSGTVTRIYSGEFEQDTGSSVATCPDCDADLPSDGSFEFCPLCGHELP